MALITPQIVKARELIGSISVFEMKPHLVHRFALVDGMLHGTHPLHSWSKVIELVEELHQLGCPKKAVLKDAQNLIIQAQMLSTHNMTQLGSYAPEKVEFQFIKPTNFSPFTPLSSSQQKQQMEKLEKFGKAYGFQPKEGNYGLGKFADIDKPNLQQPPKISPTVVYETSSPKCVVTLVPGVDGNSNYFKHLKVVTPYKPAFIAVLKTLPVYDRKWDTKAGAWNIDQKHQAWVINLIQEHWPQAQQAPAPQDYTF